MKVMHAYGTNGIITEVEMPLTAAYDWVDVIVGFDDFMDAARFGNAAGLPGRHPDQADHADRRARAAATISSGTRNSSGAGRASCVVHGGAACGWMPSSPSPGAPAARSIFNAPTRDGREKKGLPPAYELAWNHTTLQGAARRSRPSPICRSLYPFPNQLGAGREDGCDVSATRCRRISNSCASTATSPAPACRWSASPPRRGSTRSCACTRTMAARSSTRTATRWRRAA